MRGDSIDDAISDSLHGLKKPGKQEPEGEDIGPCASRVTARTYPGVAVKHARVLGGTGPTIRTTRAVSYSHIGFFDLSDDGRTMVLEYQEPEKWRITLFGTNFDRLFMNLKNNRIDWIKPLLGNAAKFGGDYACIEDITVQRIEDKE